MQASNSEALQHIQFEQRTVLVLGNEQNGIDARTLRLLDGCVEIPMIGVTRSLNAHVSGALCVWHYLTQHLV